MLVVVLAAAGIAYANVRLQAPAEIIQEDGAFYCLDGNGDKKVSCWIDFEGKRYYAGEDGKLCASGISKIEDANYCFADDASLLSGIFKYGDKLYSSESSGKLIETEGWEEHDGNTYYNTGNGECVFSSLKDVEGETYYMDPQYPKYYAKLRNSRTTLIKADYADCDINHGIYINIMPLAGQGFYSIAEGAPTGGNFFTALRYSFFQVSSVMTTTGYATADFNLWPQFSRVLLVVIMFIGASAGSTGGGIKVIRLQLLVKSMMRDIRRTVHPKSVNTVKLDGHTVDEGILSGVQGFFFAYLAVLLLSTIIVSLDGFSFETSFTAVVATLSNIGPGLGMVGPVGNYAAFSNLSKLVLSMCMLIGRLEVFPILMLFSPSAWKK